MSKEKKLFIARPRGFCAGVDRAINVVELAREVYGIPLYVKHAIVHNTHVVKRLEEKGVVFVEKVEEIPAGSHVVFSAHGSPPNDYELAKKRNLHITDATCPLVTKVHLEVQRYSRLGFDIIMVGHKNHVEPIGTLENANKESQTYLVENVAEVEALAVRNPKKVAIVTQTTLSVYETRDMLTSLKKRFPDAQLSKKEDICYATTNRQEAVSAMLPLIDGLFVVGSKTSSNSNRLAELGVSAGIYSRLIDSVADIDVEALSHIASVGISSGASVPEDIVQGVVHFFIGKGFVKTELSSNIEEDVYFVLPQDVTREASRLGRGTDIVHKHKIIPGRKMNV